MSKVVNGKLPEATLRSSVRLLFSYHFYWGRLKEIRLCLRDNLDIEQIKVIAQVYSGKPVFDKKRMAKLHHFAKEGISIENLKIIGETYNGHPMFDVNQMDEIFYAIQDNAGSDFIKEISLTSSDGIPHYTAQEMWNLRVNFFS